MTGFSRKCFGVMYCEWYGVCDFVVLSVLEVCADYGGVNVYHVCLNSGVVYGVGVCVNVCVVVCCLFLTSGWCLYSSILFKYECSMGHLFVLSWARVRQVFLGSVSE